MTVLNNYWINVKLSDVIYEALNYKLQHKLPLLYICPINLGCLSIFDPFIAVVYVYLSHIYSVVVSVYLAHLSLLFMYVCPIYRGYLSIFDPFIAVVYVYLSHLYIVIVSCI